MKVVRTLRLDAPRDRVASALCCEAFNVETERRREGVVSTRFELLEETDARVVFELHTIEYKRNKLGRLDKSATFPSVTHSVHEVAAHELRWKYIAGDGMAKRIKLSGIYSLRAEDAGTLLSHEIEVEVDIPLIGGRIAKLMAKELDATMPLIEAALRRHL